MTQNFIHFCQLIEPRLTQNDLGIIIYESALMRKQSIRIHKLVTPSLFQKDFILYKFQVTQ